MFVVIVSEGATDNDKNDEVQHFSNDILFVIYHLGFQFNCAVLRRE